MKPFTDYELKCLREVIRVWEQSVNESDKITNEIFQLERKRDEWKVQKVEYREKIEKMFLLKGE